ncbi:hypothetical protein SDRG_08198 [Saprolegnia diclina VS20]|uniref:Autophagy-related protein 101 n=1 Tax=Saprolegnia diclina (strain VS20) TaxID=1156394 RepID=T0RPJ4_SAPDV|nr:hypothetical protein SDRG_08198 [Saprolegnia diclina VS20]EQC34428.1 hypothetical protein SDRG_08198 [Saprolegnia diclina VS20]|eukprot:XP_008612290.1 hypothetical protein SDRG_08198 [Saprolegnia diclina VS20]
MAMVHELEELRVGLAELTDCVSCILHTIFFTRSPGPVHPADANCRFRPVTYAFVPDVKKQVETAIQQFTQRNMRRQSGMNSNITVIFYETRKKSAMFNLYATEDRVVWEKWVLPIRVLVHPPANPDDYCTQLESQLRHSMLHVVMTVQKETLHIPTGMYDFDLIINDF